MMRKIIYLILSSGISCAPALDLYQAYLKALSFNADYLKAIANNEAGAEAPNIARAALLPQISATGQYNENYLNQGGIQAYYHQPTYGGQFTQVIVDFSKFSKYTKGKFSAQLSELQLRNARMDLMQSVSKAYFDVLYAEDTLLATQKTRDALYKQMTQAKSAFEVGSVTIADVNDAQAGYDAAVAQEIQDKNDVINKKNVFYRLTGCDPEQIQPLQDQIHLQLPVPNSEQVWAKIAESGNLNIQVADKQVAMAREDISISRGGHYPTLSFNAQYQYQDTGGLDSTNMSAQQQQYITSIPGTPLSSYGTGYAGFQVSIPILAGGGINAQVRQAMDNYEASRQQQTSVSRTTDQNTRNSFWQVQNGVSIVKAQKAALLSAKTKLDSDQLGYQVGIRNSVDLVSAQKDYYQAFKNYQQARYQYLMAEVQLEYLSGKIDDAFMQNINANIQQ